MKLFCLCLILFTLSLPVSAAPVTYHISGYVDYSFLPAFGTLAEPDGSLVEGYFSYDPAEWDSYGSNFWSPLDGDEVRGIIFEFENASYSSLEIPLGTHRIDLEPADEFEYAFLSNQGFPDNPRRLTFIFEIHDNGDIRSIDDPLTLGPSVNIGRLIEFNNPYINPPGSGIIGDVFFTVTSVTLVLPPDADNDSVPDSLDNCILIINPDQRDTDNDGFGNRCDPDFDQNCVVNFIDLGIMQAFFLVPGDFDTDLDGDGVTNFLDISIFASGFLQPPGPSGVTSDCD